MPAFLVLAIAYVAGAVPFSFLVARRVAGRDLREHDAGTVSGTGLYEVAGFGPMVVGGLLDVAKGAVGPLLAGDRPVLAAVAVALAVAGHDWSPFLGWAGGRGISPAIGGFAVVAWPGSLILLAGLGLGRLVSQTGLGSFVAQAVLPVVTAVTFGVPGAVGGGAVVAVLWTKRLAGNRAPEERGGRVWLSRLLLDRDDGFARRPEPHA